MIRLLVDAGADVNARDTLQATPLHHAVMNERKEAAFALLELGAAVDCVDEE